MRWLNVVADSHRTHCGNADIESVRSFPEAPLSPPSAAAG